MRDLRDRERERKREGQGGKRSMRDRLMLSKEEKRIEVRKQ